MKGKWKGSKQAMLAWPKRLGNSTLFVAIVAVLGTIVLPVTLIVLLTMQIVNRYRGRGAKAKG